MRPLLALVGDLVKIKYKAYLSNGKMFDSSEGPGRKPLAVKFKSGKLLPGCARAVWPGTQFIIARPHSTCDATCDTEAPQ